MTIGRTVIFSCVVMRTLFAQGSAAGVSALVVRTSSWLLA